MKELAGEGALLGWEGELHEVPLSRACVRAVDTLMVSCSCNKKLYHCAPDYPRRIGVLGDLQPVTQTTPWTLAVLKSNPPTAF